MYLNMDEEVEEEHRNTRRLQSYRQVTGNQNRVVQFIRNREYGTLG